MTLVNSLYSMNISMTKSHIYMYKINDHAENDETSQRDYIISKVTTENAAISRLCETELTGKTKKPRCRGGVTGVGVGLRICASFP